MTMHVGGARPLNAGARCPIPDQHEVPSLEIWLDI